jgi:hypothetical protein
VWDAHCRVVEGFEVVDRINTLGTNSFAGPVTAKIVVEVRRI